MTTRLLVLAALLAGCQSAGPRPPRQEEEADHEEELSDLDRPVEELFAASCEHGGRAHACEECRYEVGVVRAPAELFEGGLLATARVERREVSDPLDLTGEVRFDGRLVSHVSTQADGIIRKVFVTLGDRVQSGQALVALDSVAVGEAQAAYLEARSTLDLVERDYQRHTALGHEGIASEKAILRAKSELEAARIRVDAAVGTLVRLGMSESAVRRLSAAGSTDHLVLRAPTAGTVLDMHAVPGEVARPETPLVTVGNNASVWVWANLY